MNQALRKRFEDIALPHLESVYRMARMLARDEAEADDLVQETFVRAYRAFAKFELRDHGAKPWLLKILHNNFYTLKGKQKRQPIAKEDIDAERVVEPPEHPPEEGITSITLDWDLFDEELKIAVEELQEEYRLALLLWAIDGLSYKEIAEICDCALGTVMSRLYRARQQLGQRLMDYAKARNLPTARFD